MKPILSLLFLSFTLMSFAQESSYSQLEKEAFVKIYLEIKENKTAPEDLLKEVLENAQLDRDGYLALRQSEEIADRNRLKELKEAAKKIQADHNAVLIAQLCQQNSITTSLYLDMQSRYHQEINFHEELRPIFKSYIESKK